MQGRLNPGSPEEARLWRKLSAAWNRKRIALPRDLAIQYTRSFPDNVWGWVTLANICASLALYGEARAALRRASRLAPKSVLPELCVQWGHFYSEKGDAARAATWYKKAVKLRPKTTSFIYLGASLAKQGRFLEAKRAHRRAIKLGGPCSEEAHYNLGLIHRAEGTYAEALADFDRALAIDPKYIPAKEARTDVLAAIKRQSGFRA